MTDIRCPRCMRFLADPIIRELKRPERTEILLGVARFVEVITHRVIGECPQHGVQTAKISQRAPERVVGFGHD